MPDQNTRTKGFHNVSKSVSILAEFCFLPTGLTHTECRSQRIISYLCRAGLVDRFALVLAVVSSLISSCVICVLRCHEDLCLTWKTKPRTPLDYSLLRNQPQKPSRTLEIIMHLKLCWLSCASLGPTHICGQIRAAVNHVGSRKWFAWYVAPNQDQLSWPWVVFTEGGLCQSAQCSCCQFPHSVVRLDSTLLPPPFGPGEGWPQPSLAHLYGWIFWLEPHGPISTVAQ